MPGVVEYAASTANHMLRSIEGHERGFWSENNGNAGIPEAPRVQFAMEALLCA